MVKIDENLAEETGIHIGDGSMNIYRGRYVYQIAGSLEEAEYYEHIAKLIEKVYDISIRPKIYPNLNKKVLRGIFDTDGSLVIEKRRFYPRVEFTTTSYPLFIQISEILKELKFNFSTWIYKDKMVSQI